MQIKWSHCTAIQLLTLWYNLKCLHNLKVYVLYIVLSTDINTPDAHSINWEALPLQSITHCTILKLLRDLFIHSRLLWHTPTEVQTKLVELRNLLDSLTMKQPLNIRQCSCDIRLTVNGPVHIFVTGAVTCLYQNQRRNLPSLMEQKYSFPRESFVYPLGDYYTHRTSPCNSFI